MATVALLGGGWLVRDPAGAPPRLLDAWLAPGALILSAFVALRGDGALVALDVLGAIVLSGAALVGFGGLCVLERPVAAIGELGGRLALLALVAGGRLLSALAAALPGRGRPGTCPGSGRRTFDSAPVASQSPERAPRSSGSIGPSHSAPSEFAWLTD